MAWADSPSALSEWHNGKAIPHRLIFLKKHVSGQSFWCVSSKKYECEALLWPKWRAFYERKVSVFRLPKYLSSVQLLSRVWFYATHGLQHARPPCPSPTPGVYSNSCPLSQWRHPTISSSFIPLSSRLQSLPASGSLQMSQFIASGGQSIGVSASTSVLPMNTQDWSPLGWTGDLFVVQGPLRSLLQHHSSKTSIQLDYSPTLTSIPNYWKNHSFD